IFLWVAVAIAYDIFRWKQLEVAYQEGTKLITTMRDRLTALVDAASVMGVFMMGALIATMINFEVTWAAAIGDRVI
ncbi:PTS system mannose/fructose/sorbose family transporter subunit IID, partial [Streptococcus suis]